MQVCRKSVGTGVGVDESVLRASTFAPACRWRTAPGLSSCTVSTAMLDQKPRSRGKESEETHAHIVLGLLAEPVVETHGTLKKSMDLPVTGALHGVRLPEGIDTSWELALRSGFVDTVNSQLWSTDLPSKVHQTCATHWVLPR